MLDPASAVAGPLWAPVRSSSSSALTEQQGSLCPAPASFGSSSPAPVADVSVDDDETVAVKRRLLIGAEMLGLLKQTDPVVADAVLPLLPPPSI